MKKEIKTHWVADIFPLNQSDVDAIADDIKEHGQKIPIRQLEDGRIVDGRNRWLACHQIGIEPLAETIEGEPTAEELLNLVASLNGKRRQLTPGQRACAAAEVIVRLPKKARGKSKRPESRRLDEVRQRFNAGKSATEQALRLFRDHRQLFERAKAGETISAVYREILSINPRFREVLPALQPCELEGLEKNILEHGCREPIATWRGFIVDGHQRYDICQKHGLLFETLECNFADENEAISFIIDTQLGRKNLSGSERIGLTEAVGMSRRMTYQCLAIASMPEDVFEELIESDDPPGVDELERIARGRVGS